MQQILQLDDLRKLTGLQREGCIRNKLESQGIAVFQSPAGIFTTVGLIEAAGKARMGLPNKEEAEEYL